MNKVNPLLSPIVSKLLVITNRVETKEMKATANQVHCCSELLWVKNHSHVSSTE